VLIDYATRFFPVAIATPVIGPFIKGGLCTTIGRLQGVRRRITYICYGAVYQGGSLHHYR
jgi:hypothetical protein